MLKRLHNIFALIVIACFVLTPSISIAAPETIPVAQDISENGEPELIQHEVNVEDSNIEPINTNKVKESVVPDPSKEGKKVFGLFLKTMLAVGLCTVLLYIVLLAFKKVFMHPFADSEPDELENLDLSTPNNKNDALKSFLNRTK